MNEGIDEYGIICDMVMQILKIDTGTDGRGIFEDGHRKQKIRFLKIAVSFSSDRLIETIEISAHSIWSNQQ